MSFFSFAFLENAMSFQGYFKYIAIFVSLGALLVVTSLYLRHGYNQISVISVFFPFINHFLARCAR